MEFDSDQVSTAEEVVSSGEQMEVDSSVDEVNVRSSGLSVCRDTSWEGVESLNSWDGNVDGRLGSVGSISSAESEERRCECPFAAVRASSRVCTKGAGGSWSSPWDDWLEGVSENSLQFAVSSASHASCTIIAFLTLVSDGITTRWFLAVGSASVGFPIRVEEESQVALFSSFLESVTADWSWEDAWSRDGSVVEGLDRSGLVGNSVSGVSESSVLSVRHALDFREDEPLDSFGTWWHGLRTSVGEGGKVGREGKGQSDWNSDLSLSAVVGNTESGASVDSKVVVIDSIIALLSVGGINDTITTERNSAIGSAGVWLSVGVAGSVITLFKAVKNTVTTNGESAVGSASVRSVGVSGSEIALFSCFKVSITAFVSASWVTTITSNVVVVIALFAKINDTITTSWETAGSSASVGGRVVVSGTIITGFAGVDDTITANWTETSSPATVGGICVVASVVAFLGRTNGSESTTAHLGTIG